VNKTLASLALLLVSTTAFDDQVIPDTPIGKIYATWIAAYNAADQKQLLHFKATYNREIFSDPSGNRTVPGLKKMAIT